MSALVLEGAADQVTAPDRGELVAHFGRGSCGWRLVLLRSLGLSAWAGLWRIVDK